jgi:hypothetical protein
VCLNKCVTLVVGPEISTLPIPEPISSIYLPSQPVSLRLVCTFIVILENASGGLIVCTAQQIFDETEDDELGTTAWRYERDENACEA